MFCQKKYILLHAELKRTDLPSITNQTQNLF